MSSDSNSDTLHQEEPIAMDPEAEDKVSVSDPDEDDVDLDQDEVTLANGNIVKKLLRRGEGTRPPNGAEVFVHYVGTLLDGTPFDSSRDRNEQFKFKLGEGQVIEGWDKGVATMRNGELARFTIKPELAYGHQGNPPKIPADATLVFEVELFGWEVYERVTPDGGVTKEVLKKGEGYQHPNDGAKATLKYCARVVAGPEFENHMDQPIVMHIGDDLSIPRGLETGIRNLLKGEHVRLFCTPDYAYGAKGDPAKGIPPNAQIVYDLELVDFERGKETWQMSIDEKIEAMKHRKALGNELFKMERWQDADKRYELALAVMRNESDLSDEQQRVSNEISVQCHSNIAACKLKLKNWKGAHDAASEALKLDDHSVKALFRRGQAYFETREEELALADLKAALAIEPNNDAVKRLLSQVKARIKQQVDRERNLFAGFFNKVNLTATEATPTPSHLAAPKPVSAAPVTPSPAPMETDEQRILSQVEAEIAREAPDAIVKRQNAAVANVLAAAGVGVSQHQAQQPSHEEVVSAPSPLSPSSVSQDNDVSMASPPSPAASSSVVSTTAETTVAPEDIKPVIAAQVPPARPVESDSAKGARPPVNRKSENSAGAVNATTSATSPSKGSATTTARHGSGSKRKGKRR